MSIWLPASSLEEPHRELTELIEMRLVPLGKALRMARSGEIKTAPAPWHCSGVRRSSVLDRLLVLDLAFASSSQLRYNHIRFDVPCRIRVIGFAS